MPVAIAALASAGAMEQKRKELAAWSAAVTREVLSDGIASGGESRSGMLIFMRPPKLAGELVISVVDINSAVRYTVRLPVPASE